MSHIHVHREPKSHRLRFPKQKIVKKRLHSIKNQSDSEFV